MESGHCLQHIRAETYQVCQNRAPFLVILSASEESRILSREFSE